MKTFGLLPDRAWIWLDFPDFKHDYIKEVYWSDVCFAGHQWEVNIGSGNGLVLSGIITWLCDILALVWHFGPACVTFRPGLCDILALSCVTKASACHHTPILTTGAVYRKFHRSSVSKTTWQLSSNSTESSPIRVIVSELSWLHLNTSIWKVQGIASRAQRPLTTALWDNNFPSLRGATWRNNGSSTWNGSRFDLDDRHLGGEYGHPWGEIKNVMV